MSIWLTIAVIAVVWIALIVVIVVFMMGASKLRRREEAAQRKHMSDRAGQSGHNNKNDAA